MRVSRVGTEELAPTAEVTVTVTKSDGSTVSKTTTVGFYSRAAKVRDYVYVDGSYSDIYDNSKTLVGICFYIDPGNPQLRLMLAVKSPGAFAWGIGTDASITLEDSPEYNVKDIAALKNWATEGAYYSNICDTQKEPPVFKKFDSTSIYSHVGFTKAERAVGDIEAGEIIPYGQYETALIIEHRNKILNDSGINLPIPVKSSQESELSSLKRLMEAQDAVVRTYYHPAASAAYAYEPTVMKGEVLNEKFRAHKWFLPSAGDLVRIAWYMSQTGETSNGIFENAITLGLISRMPDFTPQSYTGWQTSCEDYANCSVLCARKCFAGHYRTYGIKNTAQTVMPICKF